MSDSRQSNIEEAIATERERDHYKAALGRIAGGEPDASVIAREALDSTPGGLRAGEYTATHTGPLTADQLAEDVEPALGPKTPADEEARRHALEHADAQGGGDFG